MRRIKLFLLTSLSLLFITNVESAHTIRKQQVPIDPKEKAKGREAPDDLPPPRKKALKAPQLQTVM